MTARRTQRLLARLADPALAAFIVLLVVGLSLVLFQIAPLELTTPRLG